MNLFGSAFWNFYATCYDTIGELFPYREMLERVIAAMSPLEGSRVLDAGCGTGNLEMQLLAQNMELQVEALDFSAVMIAHATRKQNLAAARMTPTGTGEEPPVIRFSRADLDEPLPYTDQSFHIVTSINCLYALPRPEFTLQEIHRVLKPGGKLVVAELKANANMWIIFGQHLLHRPVGGTMGWLAHLVRTLKGLPRWLLFGLLNIAIYRRATSGSYAFRTAEEWSHLLQQFNFLKVDVEPVYAGQANLVRAAKAG